MESEQREEVVSDVATAAEFPEIVGGDGGKIQSVIQFSEGQQSGVGGDGSTAKRQPDFGVELKSARGFFAVTHQVPPGWVRCLKKHAKFMSEL